MALDLTALASIIREKYGDQYVQDETFKKAPLVALLSKNETFYESPFRTPLRYADIASTSADFTTAQNKAATASSKYKAFYVTRTNLFTVGRVDGEALEATANKKGGMVDAAKDLVDSGINSNRRAVAKALYRKGWGDLGIVLSTNLTATTFQVSIADSYNFEMDQDLVFCSTQSASVYRSTTVATITNVDRNTGIITVSGGNLTTIGVAAGDYAFENMDRQNSATPSRVMPVGLGAYILDAAPSAGQTLFQLDQSTGDTVRMAGNRLDTTTTGKSIEESLIEMINTVTSMGGTPDYAFLPYTQYTNLAKSLMGRVQYAEVSVNAKVGFRGITFECATGEVTVLPDINCPSNRGFVLQLDTWELATMGAAFRTIDGDDNTILRTPTADQYEVRMVTRGNLRCWAPAYNGVILF